jgi:hypothetical protein
MRGDETRKPRLHALAPVMTSEGGMAPEQYRTRPAELDMTGPSFGFDKSLS